MSAVSQEYLLSLIKQLGFTAADGEDGVYCKGYLNHSSYLLWVNFNTEEIDYGTKITLGDKTTSNFKHAENFVVLECVDRLLEKGYPPQNITLEKKWNLGHREKGKLDIFITDKNGVAYLMIECKTWGTEYEKEYKKTRKDGGQLFSYYQQDKAARYLCLYASQWIDDKIEYRNGIIPVEEAWRELNNQKEVHIQWNKNFNTNGVFESWAESYGVKTKALTRHDLETLTEEDSGLIFNQFAEILRHNVVSDKPNAFNKILNLFLCKILDETTKNEDDELEFQWIEGKDDFKSLQLRLNDLYKEGMKRFLDIDVTDYTDEEIETLLKNTASEEKIKEVINNLRLQKNPEFAFKEVYDEESFEANAQVVKEVVELLQKYQIRYGHKQQFLGNFFELLLNTSIKQEAGQFFTPVPIAKFIVSSLPIREFINERITKRAADILPFAIDYATGSGHFLTEWMDEVQHIIEGIDTQKATNTIRRMIESWKADQFAWASKYVYGIDADYRLVKTAKVSAFLNGDGEATIICADGLANFRKSTSYQGALKEFQKSNPRENSQFDVLIANPPYSIASFKNTLRDGEKSFELYDKLTDQSSEVECLFIERAKQLLKEGGMAGIILPSSILSNGGIYTAAREILLKYFYIRAITELNSNTFMATGTNTVVLFMERRADNDGHNIEDAIERFFSAPKDVTVSGIEKAFSKYVTHVYDELPFDVYLDWVRGEVNEAMQDHQLYRDYRHAFDASSKVKALKRKKAFKEKSHTEQKVELDRMFREDMITCEKERMLYFLLAYPQQTTLVKVGDKKAGKAFLGYEFSNRRGHEGIRMFTDEKKKPSTKLYDVDTLDNPAKANYHIRHAFMGEEVPIPSELEKNISVLPLIDMLDLQRHGFEKSISLTRKKKVKIKSKWELVRFINVIDVEYGTRIVRKEEEGTLFPVYGGGGETFKADKYNRESQYVISRFGMSPWCVRFVKGKFFLNDSGFTVKPKSNTIHEDYLDLYLFLNQDIIYHCGRGVAQKNIDFTIFGNQKIPLPPLPVQQQIVDDIAVIETREREAKERIIALREEIEGVVAPHLSSEKWELVRLGEVCTLIRRGKSARYGDSKIQIIKSGQARGLREFDFSERHFVSQKFILDERQLQEGDLLLNSSGVGTAGRVTYFELKGDFVADSHITIIRFRKERVIPLFALYIFWKIGFKNLEGLALGSSGQIEITLDKIRDFQIPLPPLSVQKEVVAQIEQLESQIVDLEEDLSKIPDEKKAILKKYLE